MDKIETRYADNVETRFLETDQGNWIEGYASVFNQSYFLPAEGFHESINPDAFNRSLASGRAVESRYNHSRDHVLGRTDLGTLQVSIDDKGLKYRVKFNPEDPDHCKVRAKISSNLIEGSSFTFIPKKYKFRTKDNQDVCEIVDCELLELGPVNVPASKFTDATIRSNDGGSVLSREYKSWKETMTRIERLNSI